MQFLRIMGLLAALISAVNCGGFSFVGFVSNPGGTVNLTGTVSAVQSGFVTELNGISPTTIVTFDYSGVPVTISFCGDYESAFPLNQTVRVTYTAGVICSTLLQVVVVDESAISGSAADPSSLPSSGIV